MIKIKLPAKGPRQKCARCGTEVAQRGMPSHQSGTPCRVAAERREFELRGLVPVPRSIERILVKAGVPFEVGAHSYDSGGPGRYSAVMYKTWVLPWVAMLRDSYRAEQRRRINTRRDWVDGGKVGSTPAKLLVGSKPLVEWMRAVMAVKEGILEVATALQLGGAETACHLLENIVNNKQGTGDRP